MEEFLTYDATWHRFHVFDAATGYWHGVTDTLALGAELRLGPL